MSIEWWSAENPVAWWWSFLISASALNITIWFWVKLTRWNVAQGEVVSCPLYSDPMLSGSSCALARFWLKRRDPGQWMIVLSGLYVFGCAFRSVLPRADVQRIVLFDTWFSSVMVGRTVATIAEMAFVAQWSLLFALLSERLNRRMLAQVSQFVLVLIALAECFSWSAVITTNYLGNSIEESLWAITYTLVGFALVRIATALENPFRSAALFGALGSALYVGFMVFVDVPMYVNRWRMDLSVNKENLGLWQGLVDLNTRWVVTHSIEDWRSEIPWMTLYFSAAVLVSLALCALPVRAEELQRLKVRAE